MRRAKRRVVAGGTAWFPGLHIGSTLAKQCDRGLLAKDLSTAILIRTSAASDARMGGATLPAMSNSGSGNGDYRHGASHGGC